MSVDTRTPRFDEQPALSMTKVDCDPAQVIVNHASFRVQLAPGQRARLRGVTPAGAPRIPAMSGPGMGRGRRAPVVWSGRSAPGDPGATGLLQAVRNSTAARPGVTGRPDTAYDPYDPYASYELEGGRGGAGTQVIPRLEETQPTPVIGGPRSGGPLLPPMRQAVGAFDPVESGPGPYAADGYGPDDYDRDRDRDDDDFDITDTRDRRQSADSVRHAYYPGRRMNLGVVLLPMRVFLGFISIYAGMGKLCDPVYFDGGDRGSMVKWLTSLHPWALAEPLREFALSHPVGAGLSIAFLQVVVGVLTVLGLWQRVAASVGALLSAALLVTVSWRTVPVYDAPDIIYLAAWSPLVIAGAPVYSADGRLAGEAWRKLGPRSEIWDLRRRVLRRGAVVAAVVVGLTLLIGSVLGGAVRSSGVVTVPGPNGVPTNQLPGSPLPEKSRSGGKASRSPAGQQPTPSRSTAPRTPSAKPSTPATGTVRESGQATAGTGRPSQTQGTGQQPPQQTTPQQPPPATSSGPSSAGPTGGSTAGGSDPGNGSTGSTDGSAGGSGRNPIGGLLG
ncbi:DoxX family membrane protein [Streptomyces sp. NBC_01260]|uniref:DoxX family membrane protein n=1 Tax=unclassified Streptomyces TaxID=2593676 RepID=UPI000FB39D80|nr:MULTISPECIES: DoxX family membrane protein [unclassified Streptomyces]MCX4770891.1 DoxX family membrane protein [Streptomyces sp. NBC_01285]ROQ81724.1 putative membrane protein YphA (DoxX/SURF4 family) [Streptomyces sp. CEV 2-1]